jgi:hypothetical protein
MLSSNRILRGGLPHASQSCVTAQLATNRAWGSAVTEMIKNKNKEFIILPRTILVLTRVNEAVVGLVLILILIPPPCPATFLFSCSATSLGTLRFTATGKRIERHRNPLGLHTIAKRLPGPEVLAGATAKPAVRLALPPAAESSRNLKVCPCVH